jgi:hypothetical protein
MQKLLICCLLALSPFTGIKGSTLLQLSLNDMIQQSTLIVRGKTQPTYTAFRGPVVYTHYQLQVSEILKGTAAQQMDIAVPGGVANGLRQSIAGAPTLAGGQEYVLFLWTGKSGLTQVIGLSQGLFSVTTNSSGQAMVVRGAATELMLNSAGQPVTDSNLQMPLTDLRTRIQNVLSGAGQ